MQLSNASIVGLRRVEGASTTSDATIKLELPTTNIPPYSIYSGQPVILRGTNPTGQQLNVTEIYTVSSSALLALCSPILVTTRCNAYSLIEI